MSSKKRKQEKRKEREVRKRFPWFYAAAGVIYTALIISRTIIKVNLKSAPGLYSLAVIDSFMILFSVILIILCVKKMVSKNNKVFSVCMCIICIVAAVNSSLDIIDPMKDILYGVQIVTTNQFQLMGKRRNLKVRFENNVGEQNVVDITQEQKDAVENKTSIDEHNYYTEKYLNNYDKSITIEYYEFTGIVVGIYVNE